MLIPTQAFEDVARCIAGHDAIHEYTTVNAKTVLARAIKAQEELGFKVVHLVNGVTAYMQKGVGERVRVIHSAKPAFEAWAVATPESYKRLRGKFIADPAFALRGTKAEKDGNRYSVFKHEKTNGLVRIIYRKVPLFPGTFGKPFS